MLITAIYTVGVLSAIYSSFFCEPGKTACFRRLFRHDKRSATILLTLLVYPQSALITDQALRGKRPYGDVKALVVMMIASKLVGTILG
ncbi:DUF2837 family protein [Bacillus sp. CECT 9360]|uniref:lipid II flippase family protein n=1 Tax=Bacillus sp. CECT 9360 TaxID=2845821 RepID=UPI0020985DDA|nr:DUF2837 family protein [Bacillus sp. CECT 9360]